MRAVLPGTAGSALGLRASRSRGDGVVQARSGRPRGDLQHLGDLHERQPEVVVQDEDRPLLDREPAERPLQFVAVGQGVARSGVESPFMGSTRTVATHGRARCDSS